MSERTENSGGIPIRDGRDDYGRIVGQRDAQGQPVVSVFAGDQEVARYAAQAKALRLVAVPINLATVGLLGKNEVQLVVIAGATSELPKPAVLAVALANLGAGLVDSGLHSYKLAWVNAAGQTLPSVASSQVTTVVASNGKVNVTVPALATGATGANIYRTVAGDTGSYKLVNPSPVTAGVYVDNIADAALGTVAPVANTTGIAQPDAPTVVLDAAAGLITAGTHSWKIQWINAAGHSLQSTAKSSVLTSVPADHGQVDITIPAFPAGATGCNVYRTVATDAGNYKLVNATPILAAGTYTDNIADGSLGADVVATDTSQVATPSAPAVALANLGAGLITNGTHSYKLSWIDGTGHSVPSDKSAVLTTATATNGKANVTVPALPAGATGANIFRTKAGDAGLYYLVNDTPVTAGVYVDNVADGSLGAEEDSGDTSGGTFTLVHGSDTSDAIQWNALQAAIQTALNNGFGAGVVTVVGNCPSFTVEFIGAAGAQAIALMTVGDNSLEPGTATITITEARPGSSAGGVQVCDIRGGDLLLAAFLLMGTAFDGTTPTLVISSNAGVLFSLALTSAATQAPAGFAALTPVTASVGAFTEDQAITMLVSGAPGSTEGEGILYLVLGIGPGSSPDVELSA